MKTLIVEGQNGDFTMMRYGKNIKDMDRSFDYEFWQRQGTAAIIDAALELIHLYYQEHGIRDTRIQRTVEHFQRTRG